MGIITGVRSWISRRGKDANDDSQSDNSKVGAEVYIITAVIWIVWLFSLLVHQNNF